MRIVSSDGKVVVVEDPSEEDLERIAREGPAGVVVVAREAEPPPIPKGLHPLEASVVKPELAEVAAAQLRARRAQFHLEPRKAVARRDLLRGEVFDKRPIPQVISQSLCLARFGCNQCAEACPAKAITASNGSISIDPGKCTECGLCISACPTGALAAPGADDLELAIALNAARRHGVAKIVFTCHKSNEVSAEGRYVYKLPCIGAVGAEWVLEAGAVVGEVELRCPDPKCPVGGAGPALSAAREVAEAFGASVEAGEGFVKIKASWGAEVGALSGTRRRDYAEVLKSLRRLYADKKAPLKMYEVRVDPDKCTLCGVCFAKCPERAFDVGRDGDAVKLYLNTAKCAGCGYCAAVCPEKAIAVSKVDALLPEVEEKAVDYVVRCKSCGRAFDTLKHVQAVKAKLGIKGDPEWLYLCPECRRYYAAKKMLESALGRR